MNLLKRPTFEEIEHVYQDISQANLGYESELEFFKFHNVHGH